MKIFNIIIFGFLLLTSCSSNKELDRTISKNDQSIKELNRSLEINRYNITEIQCAIDVNIKTLYPKSELKYLKPEDKLNFLNALYYKEILECMDKKYDNKI